MLNFTKNKTYIYISQHNRRNKNLARIKLQI